jgi:hypothetical protein
MPMQSRTGARALKWAALLRYVLKAPFTESNAEGG